MRGLDIHKPFPLRRPQSKDTGGTERDGDDGRAFDDLSEPYL